VELADLDMDGLFLAIAKNAERDRGSGRDLAYRDLECAAIDDLVSV